MYCGKVLCFNVDSTMSFHYHIDKHETWYVFNGSIVIKGINPDTAEEYQITAYEGSVINIPRGTIHQVRAVTNAIIFEVSTTDNNEDNYRVEKGDSQK
jgi:mannose-6-phosphate isomerase-like protein (cupin superfamily)